MNTQAKVALVTAKCALGHSWNATMQIERNRFASAREGKRARFEYQYIVLPANCTECGHKWSTTKP